MGGKYPTGTEAALIAKFLQDAQGLKVEAGQSTAMNAICQFMQKLQKSGPVDIDGNR